MAKLTPAERERYDVLAGAHGGAQRGRATAELGDPRLIGKVLSGPAGEVVHGIVKAPKDRDVIEDPAAWEEQRRTERAARDEIRAPYLAPDRSPVRITRVATRGKSQLREVADYLGSSGLAGRPDLVYGAYRVPDLISPSSFGGEGGGIVEWDVVHAAGEALPRAETPAAQTLAAKDVLVAALARRAGAARRGPRAAPARRRRHRARADAGDRARRRDRQARRRLGRQQHEDRGAGERRAPARDPAVTGRRRADGPARGPAGGRGGRRAAVGRDRRRGPSGAPAPRAAAVTVPVSAADAAGAADRLPRDRRRRARRRLQRPGHAPPAVRPHGPHEREAGRARTGGGPDLPCADGKPRKRMAGGHHIVFAYRDAPAYAEGRARFDAYAEGELKAHLRRGLEPARAVPKPPNKLMRTVDRVADVVDFFIGEMGAEDNFVPPRYCWPPR